MGKLRSIMFPLFALALPLSLSGLFYLLRDNAPLMAWWVTHLMGPVERALGRLWGLFPFSVGELLTALFLLGNVVWLMLALSRWREGIKSFLRRLLALIGAWLWLWAGLNWLWNPAYYAQRAAELSTQVPREEDGSFLYDRAGWIDYYEELYDGAEELFPCLKLDTGRPKGLVCSRLQSILGFTGVYFPFTGEANVNVDAPPCLVPATIAHEMAHQRMVADEKEANFVGIAACLTSDNVVFQYSGALEGLISLSNALYDLSPQTWWAVADAFFTPELDRDWEDNRAYWDALRSPVEEKAGQTYDAYLKGNGQQLGLLSYGACVDLLVTWEKLNSLPPALLEE